MIKPLPDCFLENAIAHRGLHDLSKCRPENSGTAVQAAVDANYAIEIDIQLTADDQAVVFHDYDLNRLTDGKGSIRQRRTQDLGSIPLSGGSGEGIPTLERILGIIDGKVPLLIEIKDQDGSLGPEVGILEAAVASAIEGYSGPLAVMSYNPHSVAAMQALAPDVPRGIVSEAFQRVDWDLPTDQLIALALLSSATTSATCIIRVWPS